MTNFYKLSLLFVLTLISMGTWAQTPVYVNAAATGGNNGTSWTDAYTDLQAAINAATSGDQIWVAKGTYHPTENLGETTDERDKTFILREGVKVYGGFAGNEDPTSFDLNARDFVNNETILSGAFTGNTVAVDEDGVVTEITGNGNNAHHIVVSWNNSSATVLDGFTISGGNANVSTAVTPEEGYAFNRHRGSAIYILRSSPTLNNLVIKNNRATSQYPGAIHIDGGKELTSGSPTEEVHIGNTEITGNIATYTAHDTPLSRAYGGGIQVVGASADYVVPVRLHNVNVHRNRSLGTGGGIAVRGNADITIEKSTFHLNKATEAGGAIRAVGSTSILRISDDSRFTDNEAKIGGAIYTTGSAFIKDSFFTGNKTNDTETANGNGGAINGNSGSALDIDNTVFSGNIAANGGFGGAISSTSTASTTFTIRNSTFTENTSTAGGAIYVSGNNTTNRRQIRNSVFYKNHSTNFGGALTFGGGPGNIINSTFYQNTGNGQIRVTASSNNVVNVYNSIIRRESGTTPADFSLASGGVLTVINSFVQDAAPGNATFTDTETTDPQFINTTNPEDAGFLRLSSTSTAIDAGDNDLYTNAGGNLADDIDLAGNPRLSDTNIDIGAYEYQGTTSPAGDIIYVNNVAIGGNNGTTWAAAYTDLQTAINAATEGNQIWVAAGVYKPITPVDVANVTTAERGATFQLPNGVAIYGGFVGTENPATFDLSTRDFDTNTTILSGDIDNNDPGTDGITTTPTGHNSYNVVTASGVNNTAVLDGFTITGGLADATDYSATDDIVKSANGAGIYNDGGSPTMGNLHITGNKVSLRGGGMFNTGDGATPTMTHIQITHNEAGFRGGGMANQSNSSPKLTSAVISSNRVTGWGGGIFNWNSITQLTNAQITGNVAVNGSDNGQGGGLYSTGGTAAVPKNPVLTNVVISGNYAQQYGGAMRHGGGNNTSILTNSIVWANGIAASTETNNSIYVDIHANSRNNLIYIATQTIANNNPNQVASNILPNSHPSTIPATDIFENPIAPSATPTTGGDYRLKAGSIAINAGDNDVYTLTGGDLANDLDLTGLPRLVSTNIDLGPYEYQVEIIPAENILFVKHDATGTGTGANWVNAMNELSDALQTANDPANNIQQIWVATGSYKPVTPVDVANVTDAERLETFQLINNVAVYGGFAGTEDPATFDLSTRDFDVNRTILSGDIDNNDTGSIITDPTTQVKGRNSRNVVVGSGTNNTAVLDGFTITAGYSDEEIGGTSSRERNGAGIHNSAGSPTLRNLVISGNLSHRNAGGIYNNGGSPEITDVVVSHNVAHTNVGAGITILSNSHLVLRNLKITHNEAQSNGGGIYIETNSSATLIDTEVSYNTTAGSSGGGGLYVSSSSTASIIGSEFIGNKAIAASGGAIFKAQSGTISSINHTKFIDNTATVNGGAIHINYGNGGTAGANPVPINQSLFVNNSSTSNGGAISLLNSGVTALNGVTMYGNQANGAGGVINAAGTTARTIAIQNSILYGNTSGSGTHDVTGPASATFDIKHSITQVTGTDGVDGVLVGADPLFVSTDDTDAVNFLRLGSGSPAVNAGNNDGNTDTEDLAGNTRVYAGMVDLGAYESLYENIATIDNILPRSVQSGTPLADLALPTGSDATVTLSNGNTATLAVETNPSNWELPGGGSYNPNAGGTYTFLVPVELLPASDPNWFSNGNDLKAAFEVTVQGPPTLELRWNGEAIPESRLELAPNETGELTVVTSSDAVPEITASPGAPVSLSSSSSPTTVTATGNGIGQIMVTLPATANFESATLTIDVEVDRVIPTVQVRWNGAAIPTSGLQLMIGEEGALSVTTTSDAVPNITADALLSLSSATSPSNVTAAGYGAGQITVTLAETATFQGTTLTMPVQVNKLAQQITLYAPQGVLLRERTASLIAVSSSSGLPVTLAVDDPSIASLSGTDLILHRSGIIRITATQEGDGTYAAAEPVTVEIRVIDDKNDRLRVHQALSPNGDGVNDFLHIEGIEKYPDNKLLIFNSARKMIQEIQGYNNESNVFTGEGVHDGTYFYRLNYVTPEGEHKRLQGFFVIKRN